MKKYILSLIVLFLYCLTFFYQSFAGFLPEKFSKSDRKKLDAALQIFLDDDYVQDNRLVYSFKKKNGDVLVPLLVKSTLDLSRYVESLGGFIGSKHGSVFTAYIPVAGIARLAEQSFVEYIESAKLLTPETDTSLPKNGGTFIHNIPPAGIRGQGVIIGITDSGIDLSHPDFKDSQG